MLGRRQRLSLILSSNVVADQWHGSGEHNLLLSTTATKVKEICKCQELFLLLGSFMETFAGTTCNIVRETLSGNLHFLTKLIVIMINPNTPYRLCFHPALF